MIFQDLTSPLPSILLSTAICLLFLCTFYIYNRLNYWKRKRIPYVKPAPMFGNFFEVAIRKKDIGEQITELYHKNTASPYIGIHIFNSPYLLIKDPELVKQVLIRDFNLFINKPFANNEKVDPMAYHSLFSAKDTIWKAIRTKISPVYTSGKMKLMTPLISQVSKNLVSYLDNKLDQTLDMTKVMSKFTVDVISLCAFGIDSHCLKYEDSVMRTMAAQMINENSFFRTFSVFCFTFYPTLVNLLKLTFTDRQSTDYFSKVFKETREKRLKESIVRNDLIDILHKIKNEETERDTYKLGE